MLIDFYILPSADPDARLSFACRLTEKAWRMGHRVYLQCADQAQLKALDERLWSFKGEAFIPHASLAEDAEGAVTLGHGDDAPQQHQDLLINLELKVPSFFQRFARVAELVVQEPALLQASRQRFRYYRNLGYPLHNHKLSRI